MIQLVESQKVKVRYEHGGYKYTLDVEVTKISSSSEFIGLIERAFGAGVGVVDGGEMLKLVGQKSTFKNDDIVLI